MKKSKAELSFDLMVDCPECGFNFDLMNSPHDDEGEFSMPIFNNDWDKCKENVVCCPECKKKFGIEEVYY